jgi:O-antigen/teichoic acid export membrane protein
MFRLKKYIHKIAFFPLIALANFLMFFRLLALAKIFNLSDFGQFSMGMLIANSFCLFGGVGFYQLLQQKLPRLHISKKKKEALILTNQAIVSTLSIFIIVVLIIFAFAGKLRYEPLFLLISAFAGLSQQLFLVFTLQSRSANDSLGYSLEILIRNFSVTITIVMLAIFFQSPVLCILTDAILTFVIGFIIFFKNYNFFSLNYFFLSIKLLKNVEWKKIIYLFMLSAFGFFIANADRWIAGIYFDKQKFGLYSFGFLILTISQSVQAIINVVTFPSISNIYQIYGAKKAFIYTKKIAILAITIAACFLPFFFFLANFMIGRFYPSFFSVKYVIALFMIVSLFKISDFWSSFLIISGKEKILLFIQFVLSASSGLTLLVILCFFSLTINTLALFVLFNNLIIYSAVVIYSHKVYKLA